MRRYSDKLLFSSILDMKFLQRFANRFKNSLLFPCGAHFWLCCPYLMDDKWHEKYIRNIISMKQMIYAKKPYVGTKKNVFFKKSFPLPLNPLDL